MNDTTIPADQAILIPSVMDIMHRVHADLLHLIEEPAQPNDTKSMRMAKQYYEECMDKERRQTLGSAPLTALIDRIGGWPLLMGAADAQGDPIREWWQIAAMFARAGVKADHLIGIRVVQDLKNRTKRAIYVYKQCSAGRRICAILIVYVHFCN